MSPLQRRYLFLRFSWERRRRRCRDTAASFALSPLGERIWWIRDALTNEQKDEVDEYFIRCLGHELRVIRELGGEP